MRDQFNPIRSVDGVELPTPSGYTWNIEDVSDSDAGRTEDLVMNKKRKGQIIKLELTWNNVSIEDASRILNAFNPQYIQICYLDAKVGTWVTSEFYVGNRVAPLYNSAQGLWTKISFNVIQRNAVSVEGDD